MFSRTQGHAMPSSAVNTTAAVLLPRGQLRNLGEAALVGWRGLRVFSMQTGAPHAR